MDRILAQPFCGTSPDTILSVSLCDQLVAVSSFSQVYDPSALTIIEYGQMGSALLWNFDAYCFFQQGSVVN